jgi:hypothetical protein
MTKFQRGLVVFGVLGTLVGIASLILFLVNRPVYRIDAIQVSLVEYPQEIINVGAHEIKIQVLFDEVQVKDLKQIVIALENTGNRVVSEAGNTSLYLEFPSAVQLLSTNVGNKPDKDMFLSAKIEEDTDRIHIQFDMLKLNEGFSLSVFFMGDLSEGFPKLEGRSIAELRSATELVKEREGTLSLAGILTAFGIVLAFLAALISGRLTMLLRKTQAMEEALAAKAGAHAELSEEAPTRVEAKSKNSGTSNHRNNSGRKNANNH